MMKFFFIILISFFSFSKTSKVKKYNVEESFNRFIIELNDTTACVCFKLDNLKKYKNFYLRADCDDINSKIDKTLYYNYIYSCDSKTTCDDIYLNNYLENNNRIFEIQNSAGFINEYIFNMPDENKNAILIQYKNFTGETFTIQNIGKFNSRLTYIIVLVICVVSIMIIHIIFYIILYKDTKFD